MGRTIKKYVGVGRESRGWGRLQYFTEVRIGASLGLEGSKRGNPDLARGGGWQQFSRELRNYISLGRCKFRRLLKKLGAVGH